MDQLAHDQRSDQRLTPDRDNLACPTLKHLWAAAWLPLLCEAGSSRYPEQEIARSQPYFVVDSSAVGRQARTVEAVVDGTDELLVLCRLASHTFRSVALRPLGTIALMTLSDELPVYCQTYHAAAAFGPILMHP